MSYGIEIRNIDSNVIIDEKRKSYFVRGTGTGVSPGTIGNGGLDPDIPNSGVNGNGAILNSDLSFMRPTSSGTYDDNTYYSLEHKKVLAPNLGRIQRRMLYQGGSTTIYKNTRTNFTGTNVSSVNYFQLAPANANGYSIAVTTDGTYGLEIFDSDGDVSFTTAGLEQYYQIDSILSWGSSGTYTASGETWAYKTTFTAPSGADIFDYYILSNNMNITNSGTNYGSKAEYRRSTRTIDFYSSSNRAQIPMVARFIDP